MPKARETCTRCSMRRQKCDRKLPCTRCVRDGQVDACSLEWPDGYNPRIHRKYPNLKKVAGGKGAHDPAIATSSYQNDDIYTNGNDISSSSPAHPSPPGSDQTLSLSSPRVGRRPSADFGMLLTSVNPYQTRTPTNLARNSSIVGQSGGLEVDDDNFMANGCSLSDRVPHGGSEQELVFLQSLIPSSRRIQQLVEYHEANLFWFHNGFNISVFRREVSSALNNSDNIDLKSHDLRWCALLFAVMAASLACANVSFAHSWGFEKNQKLLLGKQWYEAVNSCLQLGHYASKHDIYSIQAIQVSGVSAHILGFSNEQFVLYGAAYRIAQSLGLQKLAIDAIPEGPDTLRANPSQVQRAVLIERETGRKIWISLCTQDWFSIASSDMYCLHKKQFTTSKPRRINDESLLLAEDQVPLGIDFGNYMYDIASLMADFHDASTGLEDVSEQYNIVLKYDSRLRAMGSEFCLPSASLDIDAKPPWVAWARHTCRVLHAHKLIMIHRRFLSRSFTDPRFAYTRWASATAAKKILKEIEAASSDSQMPAIWSCQVHLVAAGITLCLDFLHCLETEPNYAESRDLVDRTISILKKDESVLSSRGVQLLSTLLAGGKPKPSASIPCPVHGLPCQGHAVAASRPLDVTPGMDPSWAQRQINDAFTSPLADTVLVPGDQNAQLHFRNPTTNTENMGTSGETQQPGSQNTLITTDTQGLGGNLLAPDTSFFDLFSEYYPTLSGFDNPSVFGDLFR